MRGIAFALPTILVAIGMTITAPTAGAQVGVNVGPPPECPYGYFPQPPYECAPYGYYGPEWFPNGVFLGAGPWYRGGDDFHGYVDNHFRRDHDYRGRYPDRGERGHERVDGRNFHGNELRDPHGNVVHESRQQHARHQGHERH